MLSIDKTVLILLNFFLVASDIAIPAEIATFKLRPPPGIGMVTAESH